MEDKRQLLKNISSLQHRHLNAKVIYGGDFNMITSLEEKKGGIRNLNRDAEAFTSFIRTTNLVDILPRNGSFTWTNRRGGDRHIASRLDHFLIFDSILLGGVTMESNIIPSGGSDHWPISLDATILGTPKNMPFHFEKFWLSHPNFATNIKL